MIQLASRSFRTMALSALMAVLLIALPGAKKAPVAAVDATPPDKVVSRFHDTLIDIMKRGPALGFDGRFKVLAPVADKTYDFSDMTQRAVGPSWDQMGPADRTKVTAAFRKLSISTYAHQFRSYDGETFVQTGAPKTGSQGGVLVPTQIVPKGEAPVALNYLLHNAKGWKIYDVYLAGTISEIARRRDEFGGLLRDKGASGLAAALEEKAERIASEDAAQPVAN